MSLRQIAHPGWRWSEREWAWLAAAVAACSFVFAVWPQLDLVAAAAFHGPSGFVGHRWGWVRYVYEAVPWLGRAAFLCGLLLCLLWFAKPPARPSRWRRRVAVLTASLLVGVGLLVNGALKETWGRARPSAVHQLGGPAVFAPAFRPSDQCRTNCSFVSGHAATGFAIGSIGLLGAPATRRRWLAASAVAGLFIGLCRMSQGAHFLSDVLFSGIAIWGTNLLIRAWCLRWRLRRVRWAGRPRPADCRRTLPHRPGNQA